MTVREYLKDCNKYADVTFIKARARKDAHTPGYHAEYQTTPIRTLVEWEESNLMDYYILNDKQLHQHQCQHNKHKNYSCISF